MPENKFNMQPSPELRTTKQMLVEEYNELTDGKFLRDKMQPYFRNIFTDIALRSHTPKKAADEDAQCIDNVAFFEYTQLPGIINDRFFATFEKKGNDAPIYEQSFINGLTCVYLSSLAEKMRMTFTM